MSFVRTARHQAGRVRRLLGRVRGRAAVAARRTPPPAADITVSVIVPIYNVEEYLDECLRSLRNQRHRNLQILVIDDGSPDRSAEIAQRHADEDQRIQLLRQPNGGLGSARNTGVRHATGDYLFFVDSDDVVPVGAIARLVGTARRSGSDIVAGAAQRFTATRRWRPDWVELHGEERLRVQVAESPELIRNNYTWGKIYETTFWRRCDLWFREGVSYEDQPIITQLYIRANGIDVSPEITYHWRQRDDQSSISQQMHTLADLVDRASAWEDTAEALAKEAPRPVHHMWLRTLYDTHFHWYLRNASITDDEYWRVLQHAISTVAGTTPDEVTRSALPQHRVAIELARRDLRQDFLEFKRSSGYSLAKHPARLVDAGLVFELPTYGDSQVDLPEETYLLHDDQVPLVHRIDRLSWTPEGDLRVSGWAYWRYLDLTSQDTEIWLALRNDRSGADVNVRAGRDDEALMYAPAVDIWASYDQAAFSVTVPFASGLQPGCHRTGDTWSLHVRVKTGRFDRQVRVTRVHAVGSAAFLPPLEAAGGMVHLSDLGKGRPLRLHYLERRVAVDRLAIDGADLVGTVRSLNHEPITALTLVDVESTAKHDVTLDPASVAPFRVPLAAMTGGRPRADSPLVTWSLRARVSGRRQLVLAMATPEQTTRVEGWVGDSLVRAHSSHRGAAVLTISQEQTVELDCLRVEDGQLHLGGVVPTADEGTLSVRLTSPRSRSVSTSADVRDARFSLTLPVQHTVWRYGTLPLPAAAYRIEFELERGGAAAVRGLVTVGDQLTEQLPIVYDGPRMALTMTRGEARAAHVTLVAPLGRAARGAFHRKRLEQEHQAATLADQESVGPVGEREGLLIESNFGEVAGCNGVGVQEELRRRGSTLPVYWTVKDYSVAVPAGGIALLRNSPEWFDKLRTAKYLIDNMYQPIYHRRPPGQVIIETFHGYPFKVMGHPHWADNLDAPRSRIESFDQRAGEWDYLVSPARYATPLLCRDFAYGGEVLEIGYPRNDVLTSPQAPTIRADVRASLGIRDGVTAVLYAPTFRDYLSTDDHTAPMADLLDVEQLMSALGDGHVLLIRGHAFHARTSDRPQSSGRVIDVTDYPDPSDLYLASDLAIVDYSSLRFDYGLTRKPMLFLVPDLDRYKDTRGWLFDFEPTAPGPLLSTTTEVVEAIRGLDAVVETYAAAYQRFHDDYLDLDDGHASRRLVDAVFVPRGDAPPSPDPAP